MQRRAQRRGTWGACGKRGVSPAPRDADQALSPGKWARQVTEAVRLRGKQPTLAAQSSRVRERRDAGHVRASGCAAAGTKKAACAPHRAATQVQASCGLRVLPGQAAAPPKLAHLQWATSAVAAKRAAARTSGVGKGALGTPVCRVAGRKPWARAAAQIALKEEGLGKHACTLGVGQAPKQGHLWRPPAPRCRHADKCRSRGCGGGSFTRPLCYVAESAAAGRL